MNEDRKNTPPSAPGVAPSVSGAPDLVHISIVVNVDLAAIEGLLQVCPVRG